MGIKVLFSVPDGEKVTDKALRRVLVSSICSILLCMSCLVGTTWAWFTVSLENTGNLIQIATVSETVTVTDMGKDETVDPIDGAYDLSTGKYKIRVRLTGNATGVNGLNKPKTPVYVIMSVVCAGAEDKAEYYCFSFAGSTGEAEQTVQIHCASATLRFAVTWVEPNAAIPIGNETVEIGKQS